MAIYHVEVTMPTRDEDERSRQRAEVRTFTRKTKPAAIACAIAQQRANPTARVGIRKAAATERTPVTS